MESSAEAINLSYFRNGNCSKAGLEVTAYSFKLDQPLSLSSKCYADDRLCPCFFQYYPSNTTLEGQLVCTFGSFVVPDKKNISRKLEYRPLDPTIGGCEEIQWGSQNMSVLVTTGTRSKPPSSSLGIVSAIQLVWALIILIVYRVI